jgi:hypothetical protein
MKKAYTTLFNTVYEDLSPKIGHMSNGDMEDQECTFKLNKDTIKQAYALISKEREDRRKKKQHKQNSNTPMA